jgi:hypothetical protein
MQHSGQKRGELRLVDTSAQEVLRGGETADFVRQQIHQLPLGVRTPVGQSVLEVVPDAFIGVQFGSICGKGHQVQTAGAKEQIPDRISAMDLRIVEQNNQMPTDLA